MVMIDALVAVSEDHAEATKTFQADDYGVAEDGRALEAALVEALAQTAAAQLGALARRGGMAPAPGMLVGLNDWEFHEPIPINRPLQLTVRVTRRLGPFCLIDGQVCCDGRCVARGGLKLFVGGSDDADPI
jgi:predicted hotdog family 3-hydroxylacyl-ACP dehydratase